MHRYPSRWHSKDSIAFSILCVDRWGCTFDTCHSYLAFSECRIFLVGHLLLKFKFKRALVWSCLFQRLQAGLAITVLQVEIVWLDELGQGSQSS